MRIRVRKDGMWCAAHPVEQLHKAEAGGYRIIDNTPGGHPADGMTIAVAMGGGAYMSLINPLSFEDGGPEWVMRYGDPESIRYAVASLLESYDYLLSSNINTSEAARRLKIMRSARRLALTSGSDKP